MKTLNEPYNRDAAIAEGRLRDVSHLNHKDFNPFPTFVSAGVWDVCQREWPPNGVAGTPRLVKLRRKAHEARLRQVLCLPPLFRWLEKGRTGEFSIYVGSLRWLGEPLEIQVIVEPVQKVSRRVTILLEGERLDFRMPRPAFGGSFFVM